MDCEEIRVDMREMTPEDLQEAARERGLLFRLTQTMPMTEEYFALLKELFGANIGENSIVVAPFTGAALDRLVIGSNVYINSNFLAMSRGGITVEDDVMIAANVSVLTNNHDPYDRQILLCRPVRIRKGAWIGANVVILPGVSIGRYAIVGAGAVVTKDVPDHAIAIGNPAKVVRMLDAEKLHDTEQL